MKHPLIAGVCLLLLSPGAARSDEPKPAYDPREAYREVKVEGWTVLVHQCLFEKEHGELREQTLKVLGEHLFRVTRVVPAEALAKLRRVPIWIEREHPRHACMCYHTSAEWLKQHQMNPEKAKGVEIANCKNFLEWTRHTQPWMVLHELAHAYHDRELGFDHAEVKACYDAAATAKLYDSVLHVNGRKQRHYALNNEREYFAEMTEAYFGTNDFYPFVRAELKQCDPKMHDLLEKLWGVKGTK